MGLWAYLSLLVIDHDIVWLDVPMHDSLAMAEVERFEKFVDVVSNVIVDEFWVETSEIGIVDIFEYKGRCFALTISHDVQESNNVRSARQVLQDLDLSLYLLLLDGLEDLDDAFLVVGNVDAFEDFRVLSPAYMSYQHLALSPRYRPHIPIFLTTS